MRLRGKTDRNHAEIVRALRQAGASVLSLADVGQGCPDLMIGFRGRNMLAEIKDGLLPPSKKRLTPDELTFRAGWNGQVTTIETVTEALALLNEV